jgi:hypothetical protein
MFVFVFPGPVTSKKDLLEAIAAGLHFPDYLGHNWDALEECPGDLSWIQDSEVVIDHNQMLRLAPGDRDVYLDILINAKRDHAPEKRFDFYGL